MEERFLRESVQERTKLLSFFAALCLFLSAAEYAIPKPLPFLRLGLANLPVLLSLEVFRRRDTVLLIALKVLGQGMVTGTLFSYVFLFSATGSFASGLAMLMLHALFARRALISAFGLSVAGSLASNAAQLIVARFVLFGGHTRYIAPVLLVTGFVSGSVLGVFASRFEAQSRWFALVSGKTEPDVLSQQKTPEAAQ